MTSYGSRLSLLSLLVFGALTLAFTHPLSLQAGVAVEDWHDALLNVWIMAWDAHQLTLAPLHLFDANIFHPTPRALAFSELLLSQALIGMPVTLATGNPVLGYNLVLLSTFCFSGLGAYLLVRYLTGSFAAGIAAGVIYAFSPYMLSNLAQLQLLSTQWLPFALLYLDRFLHRGIRRDSLLFLLFFALQALSSFYYAMFTALAVGLYLLWFLTFRRQLITASLIAKVVAVGALAALLIAPFALPYVTVAQNLGLQRELVETQPFSASLQQYTWASPNSLIYGSFLAPQPVIYLGDYPLDNLFPGVLVLLLAGYGLVWGGKKPSIRRRLFFLLLTLVALVLSLGPTLHVFSLKPVSLPFSLPYRVLYDHFPGFKALRAPVRFASLVLLGLAVLAGYGVAALPKKGRRGTLFSISALLFITLEYLTAPAVQITPVETGGRVPPVYGWLAQQEKTVIVELPAQLPLQGNTREMWLKPQYFSTYHWHTTPTGYSGFVPPYQEELVHRVNQFPRSRAIALLQGLGVRYVITHGHLYPMEQWEEVREMAKDHPSLTLVAQFDDDYVYQLSAGDPSEGHLTTRLILPPAVRRGNLYSPLLVLENREPRSAVLVSKGQITVTAIWTPEQGREVIYRQQVIPPLVVDSLAAVSLSLPTPYETGHYRLAIQGEGALAFNVQGEIEVGAEFTSTPQPIPLQLVGWFLDERSYQPEETITVGMRWRALGNMDDDYTVFLHLVDEGGDRQTGLDLQLEPATSNWLPGQEVDTLFQLKLPADVSPGSYTLETGTYQWLESHSWLQPSLLWDGEAQIFQRIQLGEVEVWSAP